jgi:hypothetical protein
MKAYAQVRGSRSETGNVQSQGQIGSPQKNKKIDPSDAEPLFIIFILAFLGWACASAALVYHWRKYCKGDGRAAFAQALYFGISLLLLVTALFAIL